MKVHAEYFFKYGKDDCYILVYTVGEYLYWNVTTYLPDAIKVELSRAGADTVDQWLSELDRRVTTLWSPEGKRIQ